ncbi:hypothetical protein D3C76_1100030 [compost metagenome]
MQFVDRMLDARVGTRHTRELRVEGVRPVTQARARFQAITTGRVLLLSTTDVQLIAHNQADAAAFRLIVKLASLRIAFGVGRYQRHRGVFKAVVNRQQFPRAAAFARAQRHALDQESGPLIALAGIQVTVSCVGKVDQCHPLVTA